MQLIRYGSSLKIAKPHALSIGNFDGIHLGHQKLIQTLVEDGEKLQLPTMLCSFCPLPWQKLRAEERQKETKQSYFIHSPIHNLRAKITEVQKYNLDKFLIVRFNDKFRQLSPAEFIQSFLVKQLNTAHLITGEDFKFGFQRGGSKDQLTKAQESGLFSYKAMSAYPETSNKISSSKIRELLVEGKIAQANKSLGYNFYVIGRVTTGNGVGSSIGFPTANLRLGWSFCYQQSAKDTINTKGFIPSIKGVFACKAHIYENDSAQQNKAISKSYPAVVNFGYRPTVSADKRAEKKFVVEAHLLDFKENIYGKVLKLEPFKYIRGEKKFSSVDELSQQIAKDRDYVRSTFSTYAY